MILLLAPGPLKYSFVKEGIEYFLERLSKWIKVSASFPKLKGSFAEKRERLLAEEALLSKHISSHTFLIVLDERGRSFNTQEFSQVLDKLLSTQKSLTFLVGGPEGVSEALKAKGHLLLKLSDFTLNHEIALLVLAEALYRALSLLKGHPYHREGKEGFF